MTARFAALVMVTLAVMAAAGSCGGGARGRTGTPSRSPAATATGAARTPAASRTPASDVTPVPTAASSAVGDSGIEGMVLAGPTCPVERIDSPCPERPVALRIAVFTATHSTPIDPVTTFGTGDDGRFRVELPAGGYILQRSCGPQNCPPFPSLAPTLVEVPAGAFAQVTLHADTGIR